MSLQHFYSRVPARVSLYKKRDGFDTFAHSGKLDKEFILGPLSQVYADKLKYYDDARLRRGEVPTVYSQVLLPSGESVQTAIKYLPLDFTGERSSYLAHSLILTEQESRALFSCRDAYTFNSRMFVTDISGFRITSPSSVANPSFEEVAYTTLRFTDSAAVIKKYRPDMVKSLLYSLVCAICSGGRDVYFRLPVADSMASEEALNFINAIMSILPYSLRKRMSFVSFVNDVDNYPGFNLKYAASYCDRVYPHKGVFYDFATGAISGQPAEYERNLSLVNFLYSLYDNRNVRDEFHAFVDGVEGGYDGFSLDVRSLSELVFVFWQCSGFYVEQSILPTDDTVSALFAMYSKYREGISPNHRMQVYRCLNRYVNDHRVIPIDIFGMLSNLYPGECVSAKAVALDVMLKLIHIPAMREELFDLISRNYDGEIDRVKVVVNSNLARVFYGGFLQHRILSFFDRNFGREPESTSDMIVDKLLLTIRTPQIQREIVAFLDRHYYRFTKEQKMRIYSTCLEMIPEGDTLAVMLVAYMNRRMDREDAEIKTFVTESLEKLIATALERGTAASVAILIDSNGFCEDVAASYIWKYRVGGEVFIDTLAAMGLYKRATKLIRMYKTLPDLTDEDYEALLSTFTEVKVSVLPSTLYEVLQADKSAGVSLPPKQAEHLRNTIIYPMIPHTFLDVFKVRYGKEGIKILKNYVEYIPVLTNTAQYAIVQEYQSMITFAKRGDAEGAFRIAITMPEHKLVRQDMSEHIRMCELDTATQGETTTFIFELLISYLKTGTFRLDPLYTKYRKHFEDIHNERTGIKAKVDPADRRGATDAMKIVLSCIEGMSYADDDLAAIICSPACGLEKVVNESVDGFREHPT